jgi:hypothetical protein
MIRRIPIATLAAISLLAAAPAARADDAAVQQVVTTQETKLQPDNSKMRSAIRHLTRHNAGKAKSAITTVNNDISEYRTALLKTRASTSKVKKGRMALLTALREQRAGLTSLRSAVAKYASGASYGAVKKRVDSAIRKLTAGQKDAARAARLLGLTA